MKKINLSNFVKNTSKLLAITSLLVTYSTPALTSPSLAITGLSISVGEQSQGRNTPQKGQNKEMVEAQFGSPIKRVTAVGEPPISKWVYQEFTVYFEHDIVLHSVLHR